MKEINQISKIVTARISVPINTLSAAPLKVTINSPLPIIKEIKVFSFSPSGAVTEIESGWLVKSGGTQFLPAMGSYDDLAREIYAPRPVGFAIETGELNEQLQGPPFNFTIELYNTDAAAIAYYFFIVRVTSKIDLPIAPIAADEKPGNANNA